MVKNSEKINNSSLNKIRRNTIYLITAIVIFSLGFAFGSQNSSPNSPFPKVNIVRDVPQNREEIDFALFWRTWDTLESQYFNKGEIVPAKLVFGAIQGMVAAVGDPYTIFLPPEENKLTQEDLQGGFEGVGIQIGFRGTQLAVISPLPGTPAAKANIQAGDFIIGITDEQKNVERGTVGISLPEAVQIIRGPAGSIVKLTLLRDGIEEPITAEIARAPINVPSVTLSFVGDNKDIAHLQVSRFGEETLREWDEKVLEILGSENIKGIVLDLRNNPGGFLTRSIDLASDFMDTGDLVVIEERGDGSREEFRTDRIGRLKGREVVVLINTGSASASEILAGALRDNLDTPLIGTRSFGKGTIQESLQLESGTGLHITVAKWLTPSGIWVNEEDENGDSGLKPDIEIADDTETLDDEQLQEAINTLI